MLGGAGPQEIPIDHVGDYLWKGNTVLPGLPDTFETSMGVKGVADVQNKDDTLVAADGGYVLEVTFTVKYCNRSWREHRSPLDPFPQGREANGP